MFTWLVGLLIGFVLFRNVSIGEAIFTMQEAEVNALAGPVASLLAKQKLPARIKKIIVSSNDAIAIVAAGGVYCKRVATQLGEVINELNFRAAQQAQAGQSGGRAQESGGQPAASSSNGHYAADIPDVREDLDGVGTYAAVA